MIFYLVPIIIIYAWLSLRLLKAPLHADTGQYLYRNFFVGLGKKFPLLKEPIKSIGKSVRIMFDKKSVLEEATRFMSRNSFEGYYPNYAKIGAYWLAGLPFKFFKMKANSIRFFLTFYNILSIIAVYFLGKLLFADLIGIASAALFAGYLLIPYLDSHQTHAEHFLILPFVISAIFSILGGTYGMSGLFIFSGIFAFGVFLIKPASAVIEIFILLLFPYILNLYFSGLVYFVLGFGICFLIFAAVLWKKQTLSFFLYTALSPAWVFAYKKGISANLHKSEFGSSIRKQIGAYFPFLGQMSLLLFGVGSFLYYAALSGANPEIMLLIWLLIELLVVRLQGKYYSSHLVPVILPAAIMSAEAFVKFLIPANPFYIIIFSLAALTSFISVFKYWFIYDPLEYQLELYSSLKNPNALRSGAAEVIADYVKKNTGPDDKIRVWGYNSEIYILAGRQEHHGFNEHGNTCDPPQYDGYWPAPLWRRWFIRDINFNPPVYIVDMTGKLNIENINKFSGLHYNFEKIFFGMFPVYKFLGRMGDMFGGVSDKDVMLIEENGPSLDVDGKIIGLDKFYAQVNREFINGRRDEADRLTKGGISEMIQRWYKINF